MASPDDVLNALADALETSGDFPSINHFLTYEIDYDGVNAAALFPLIEITPASMARAGQGDTNLAGYIYDDSGGKIGAIYDAEFTMVAQIDAYSIAGTQPTARHIATKVRRELYRYDDTMYGQGFEDETGDGIDSITDVVVGDPRENDELTRYEYGLRRATQEIEIRFYERINTLEEYGELPYIKTVNYPHPGDFMEGVTPEVTIEYDPTLHDENDISTGDVVEGESLDIISGEVHHAKSPMTIGGEAMVGGELSIEDL